MCVMIKSNRRYQICKKKFKGKYKFLKCGGNTSTYLYFLNLKLIDNTDKDIKNEELSETLKNPVFSDKVIKENLNESIEFQENRKKKKSILISLILLVINIVLVTLIARSLIKSADDASLTALIKTQGDRLYYLLYGLLLFVLFFVLDAICVAIILKQTTGKYRPILSYKSTIVCRYYDSVTPFAAGGQPAQIVELSKGGVSPGLATTTPIIKMTILNFVAIVTSIMFFIFVCPKIDFENSFNNIMLSILKIIAYIGVIISSIYFVIMFIVTTSKSFGRKVVRGIIKIGYTFKIIKDYRKSYNKMMRHIYEFHDSMIYLIKNPWFLIKVIFVNFVQTIVSAVIPFIVCIALTDITFATSAEMFEFLLICITKYFLCYMASSYIPLPGGTGMNEIAFILLFGPVIGSNFIVWGFLIWRVFSYYLIILQGLIYTIINTAIISFKKEKKYNSLQKSK